MAQPTLLITDTVGFLVGLSFLRTRRLLYRLFTLSCLCLDEPFQTLPDVKFNSIRTDEPSSRIADVILPVQSYFKKVPDGIATLSSNAFVTKFLSLETTFGDGALRDSYDPWSGIDLFGRARILAQHDPNASGPSGPKRTSTAEASTSGVQEKKLAVPRGTKRSSKLLSTSELTGSGEKFRADSSRKLYLYYMYNCFIF